MNKMIMSQELLTLSLGILNRCFSKWLCHSECQVFEGESCWHDVLGFPPPWLMFQTLQILFFPLIWVLYLLGLLWALMLSLSISLGVRPDTNQAGKKSCLFRVVCYRRSCRYL